MGDIDGHNLITHPLIMCVLVIALLCMLGLACKLKFISGLGDGNPQILTILVRMNR